jgi:hypothetical protein
LAVIIVIVVINDKLRWSKEVKGHAVAVGYRPRLERMDVLSFP